jgi:hypothetical protein
LKGRVRRFERQGYKVRKAGFQGSKGRVPRLGGVLAGAGGTGRARQRTPQCSAGTPSLTSTRLVSPIWRDRTSIPQGFGANPSTFGVKTIRHPEAGRARKRACWGGRNCAGAAEDTPMLCRYAFAASCHRERKALSYQIAGTCEMHRIARTPLTLSSCSTCGVLVRTDCACAMNFVLPAPPATSPQSRSNPSLSRPLICTTDRRIPATSSTNQGD